MFDSLTKRNTVFCRLPGTNTWGAFTDPVDIICANSLKNVSQCIEQLEDAIKSNHAIAGFISYEAAPAFDAVIPSKKLHNFPFLWFGVYKTLPTPVKLEKLSSPSPAETIPFEAELSKASYLKAIAKVKEYIHAGDIYQANFTFRCVGPSLEEPELLYQSIIASHPVPYTAFINMGKTKILSVSPELFYENTNSHIHSLPMKGTAPREKGYIADCQAAHKLSGDIKNRAENVMIVDMVRNDFGHICTPGTITVDPLFHVDTYQTVHQMISGVHGRLPTSCSLSVILNALFPAASITGAPKVRATEIINELELSPRKVYTGAIGCVLPNNNACFNVPIRTLICENTHTELGIGSGIVADSNPIAEWEECLTKKKFSNSGYPNFDILETILWTRQEGFKYLTDHIERAEQSQLYFGRKWEAAKINKALTAIKFDPSTLYARVRLLVSRNGDVQTEIYPLNELGWSTATPHKVKISDVPTNSDDIFLYHKTTNRAKYNNHFKDALNAGYADTIFFNERGELTEGAISNIFIKLNQKWVTPPLSSGLLAGIWRKHQLKTLQAIEQVVYVEDIKDSTELLIGNSVRGSVQVSQIINMPSGKLVNLRA